MCFSSFDCSHLKTRATSKCHFGNQTYEIGEELSSGETEGSCTIGCRCRGSKNDPEPAKFLCTHIDCPEFFGYNNYNEAEQAGKKCVKQYKHNECCSSGETCGEELLKLATCEFENRTYYEGEKIQPEALCYSCICGAGFNEKSIEENPHCQKINCNMDLHYQSKVEEGCIPVYLDK